MTENARLTAKQEAFILALLAANSVPVAARTCKINESTGYRWMKLESVQAAYKAAQKRLFEQELSALLRIVGKAIDTLDRNMSGEDVLPSSQIRAAEIVLSNAIALHKMSELEAEVEQLRTQLEVLEQEHST